jgi:hypothetical protein
MEEDRMPKKIFTQELEGTRRRGRPRKGWREEVERDLQVLGVRRWRVGDRQGKMERYCSIGQSPQRVVAPKEEEDNEVGRYLPSYILRTQNIWRPHIEFGRHVDPAPGICVPLLSTSLLPTTTTATPIASTQVFLSLYKDISYIRI